MKQSNSFKLSAAFVALVMAGCVSVQTPEYQHLMNDVELTSEASENTHSDVLTNWWTQLNDQDLNLLMASVEQHNATLKAARANVDKAFAIFDDIDDNDWPVGGLNGQYSAQRQIVPGTPMPNERISVQTRQIGVQAFWQIDVAGKLAFAERAAQADAQAAVYAWQDVQLSLFALTANTYLEYLGLKSRLAVAEETLESIQKTQQVVQAQVEVGYATELQALQVKSQIAGIQASIPVLTGAIETTRQALIALAGGDEKVKTINWSSSTIPNIEQPIPLRNSSSFLTVRPDVLAAEQQLLSANASIGVAKADLYPSVSMNGFFGFLSTEGAVLDTDNRAWSIMPSINWQVFDLDSVRARIRTADAESDISLANFEQTVLNAIAQTRNALTDYTTTQLQFYKLEEQVKANEEALALARYQYENGSIDLLTLLDIERQWLTARDSIVLSQTNLMVAFVNINTALGGGLNLNS